MGHQESEFKPFSSLADCSPGRVQAGTWAQYSHETVPVSGGRRTYGVPLEQLVTLGHSGVPRIVARLCHYIERHGMQTEALFSTPATQRNNQRAIVKMRADFDMYGDSNLERHKDVAAAAACLKQFLRELPAAVVPVEYNDNFVGTLRDECSLASRCENLSSLVHSLPPPHYALLRFLCSFLKRVTNFHSASHMSADTLGAVFGPNVFRVTSSPDGGGEGGGSAPCLRQQAAASQLVAQLIQNYDRIFNAIGQRHRPGSDRADCGDLATAGGHSNGNRDRRDDSESSASGGGIKKRVDKSLHAAVASHLLATVQQNDAPAEDEAGDRGGEPPRKRLEGDHETSSRRHPPQGKHAHRSSYQPWPASRLAECGGGVRRTGSHDNIRSRPTADTMYSTSAGRQAAVARSRSAHQVAAESEPITVPAMSSGYDLPTPWSPVYTEEVVQSSSSPSSGSECGDTPPSTETEMMCRHEQQRESERLATFPPRSREKTSRQSRDTRRRRHSRAVMVEDLAASSSAPEADDEDEEEDLSDSDTIPPLDLDCMGSEPISSTVLKGRQLTDDEVILSPRNSFILPDAEFMAAQQKLCSRFNERPPTSTGADPAEPRSYQLRQTIASAKRRVRGFEEKFESRYGYRPSHADRQKDRDVKRCLSELCRARRELKQLRQEASVPPSLVQDAPPPPPPLEKEKENRTPAVAGVTSQSLEQTVADVTKRLCEKRQTAGRPAAPEAMSREQVLAEKLALQKALLCLEERHGRPAQKHDRDLVRPLYERYRVIKRLVVKSGSPKLRDSIGELTPILEHETMTFTAADRPVISGREEEAEVGDRAGGGATERLQLDDNLHNLPVCQLRAQLTKARDDKRRLRGQLLQFEENFRTNIGRKVQKDDRGDMDDQYADYKQIKAKVKLLEVLVAKHRSRSNTM